MPICSHPSCPYEDEYQSESEFNGFKWCKTCRDRALRQKKHSRGPSNSNAAKIAKTDKLEIGYPPQFAGDWHKRMYEEWLQSLIREVERSETR
jgi:hypothetical protein